MAGALAKEALRALQDAVPFHQTLRAKYAVEVAITDLRQAYDNTRWKGGEVVAENESGSNGVAIFLAVVNEADMVNVLLHCRWGMGIEYSESGSSGKLYGGQHLHTPDRGDCVEFCSYRDFAVVATL